MGLLARLRSIRRDLMTLVVALGDPRTPRAAKVVAALVAAYAVSPIDLIPDAIPVLGLLDDAILIPLGMLLVRRLIPTALYAELRERAVDTIPRWLLRTGLVLVIATWAALLVVAWLLVRD